MKKSLPVDQNGEVIEIDGLEYYPDFLTLDEQCELMRILESQPWLNVIARRQQFYGEVYYHTTHNHKLLQPNGGSNDEDKEDQGLDMEILPAFLIDKCTRLFKEEG